MLPAHACIWIVSFWISTGRSILTFHFSISGTNCGEALSRNIILRPRTQHERTEQRSETRCLLVFCVLVSTCVHVSKCQVNLQHQILCWGSQIRDLQGCITYGDPYQSLGHLAVFTFCSVESNSATLLKTTPRLGI